MHYLKFSIVMPLFWLITLFGIVSGGAWMWLGIAFFVFIQLPADMLLPRDRSAPVYQHAWLFDGMMFLSLPMTLILVVVTLWMAGNQDDMFGVAHLMQRYLGPDIFSARERSQDHHGIHFIGALLSVSLMNGIVATNVAHELMHRKSRAQVALSRLLLLFSFDLPLVISHIYGHHIRVGRPEDHTTARRGESVYAFIWRSTVDGNLNAWEIESKRLSGQKRSPWHWTNKILQAYLGYLLVISAAFTIGGWTGAILFFFCALLTKAILESINYIQHYGLIRAAGSRISPHCSWNSDHCISSWLLFNVTRHSHHHAEPEVPFWQLHTIDQAPLLPLGYMASIMIALIPPLWFRAIASSLQEWDRQYGKCEMTRAGEMHLVQKAL